MRTASRALVVAADDGSPACAHHASRAARPPPPQPAASLVRRSDAGGGGRGDPALRRASRSRRASRRVSFAGLADAGYTKLTVDEIIALKEHGVQPEYIKPMLSAGLGALSVDQLIRLRDNGVEPGVRCRGREIRAGQRPRRAERDPASGQRRRRRRDGQDPGPGFRPLRDRGRRQAACERRRP